MVAEALPQTDSQTPPNLSDDAAPSVSEIAEAIEGTLEAGAEEGAGDAAQDQTEAVEAPSAPTEESVRAKMELEAKGDPQDWTKAERAIERRLEQSDRDQATARQQAESSHQERVRAFAEALTVAQAHRLKGRTEVFDEAGIELTQSQREKLDLYDAQAQEHVNRIGAAQFIAPVLELARRTVIAERPDDANLARDTRAASLTKLMELYGEIKAEQGREQGRKDGVPKGSRIVTDKEWETRQAANDTEAKAEQGDRTPPSRNGVATRDTRSDADRLADPRTPIEEIIRIRNRQRSAGG